MKFKICLTNSIFAPDYSNARHFDSRSEQESYFRVNELFTSAVPERNVNFGTLVNLQVYVKTGESGIGDIMSSNYAIIKELATGKFYYYFITNTSFDSANQVRLDLQIDVIQTYYLDMTFNECFIERASINRWTGDNLVANKDNYFLERDTNVPLPKYIKNTHSCRVSPFSYDDAPDLAFWLNSKLIGWIYAFLDEGSYSYDSVNFDDKLFYQFLNLGSSIGGNVSETPYIVAFAPIFNDANNTRITINGKEINIANFNEFIKANEGHVYNLKFSALSPFNSQCSYSITVDNTTLNITASATDIRVVGTNKNIGVLKRQILEPHYLTYTHVLPQSAIKKSTILAYDDDLNANPKIFNEDYQDLKIIYGASEYNYSLQKLYSTGDRIQFSYFEILTGEIAPTIITARTSGGLYRDAFYNRLGYLGENDFAIPFSKNQLSVFLANNKNFFKQKELQYSQMRTNYAINSLSTASNIITQAGTGNYLGAVSGAVGIAQGGMNLYASVQYDRANTTLTVDNMRAGIDQLVASNSNVYFNIAVNTCAIVLQEMDAVKIEKDRALHQMHHDGYVINIDGNPKDYDNIRTNWNYVKAQIDIIKTPVKIPNEVRDIIKAIFARGIRFWNTDNITYHQTNLER